MQIDTPWGRVDELRSQRLWPGPSTDPDAVRENQRRRMSAAAIGAVAERGFDGARVADVVRLSGVSRSAFYKYFSSLADLFKEVADDAWAAAWVAAVLTEDGHADMYDAALRWADRYPETALFAFRAPDGMGGEARTRHVAEYAPQVQGCDPAVAKAVVAATLRLLADYLEDGRSAAGFAVEIGPVVRELFVEGDVPGPARRQPLASALEAVPTLPRARMLAALADLIHEGAGELPTIHAVVERARCSLSTFYACFDGLDHAVACAHVDAFADADRATSGDGVGAWLRWLARRPSQATLVACYALDYHRRTTLFWGAVREQFVSAFVRELLSAEIRAGRASSLHRWLPTLDYALAGTPELRKAAA